MIKVKERKHIKKSISRLGDIDSRWIKWMGWGRRLGCHQKPARSFFIKEYQCPVCARCTGVLIASILACVVFAFYPLDWKYCMLLCTGMFIDWLIQRIGIRESTNTRRLATGLMGGFGFMTLQLYGYKQIVSWICNVLIILK